MLTRSVGLLRTSRYAAPAVQQQQASGFHSQAALQHDILWERRGPAGRTTVSGITASVFGSSGFVASFVANKLGWIGSRLVVCYRGSSESVRDLKLGGDLGAIVPHQFDLRDQHSIDKAVVRSNVVINCVAKEYPTKNYSLYDVNVEGALALAKAAKRAGVARFIHFSCIGADRESTSEFFRTKALGEEAVLSAFPDATIIRPAHIFGRGDRFLYPLARSMKTYTVHIFNSGANLVQPVLVTDVADAVIKIIEDENTMGKVYELAGPEVFTYAGIVELMRKYLDRPGRLSPWVENVELYRPGEKLYSLVAEELRQKVVNRTKHPSALGFHDLEIAPTPFTKVAEGLVQLYRTPSP